MLKIFKNLKKTNWLLILFVVLLIVTQVYLDLRMPDYMTEITQLVQTPGSIMADILRAGGWMLACAIGSLICSMIVAACSAKIATDFGAILRSRMFDKVQSFSTAEIGRFSTASLITRTTNDITQVQMLIVLGLQAIIKAPMMAIFAITKIATKSSQWTIATGVAVAILLIIVIIAVRIVMPKFKSLQILTDDLNRVTRENLTGIRVVHAYNAEDYQEAKFAETNNILTATHLFTGRALSTLMPSIQLVMSGLTLSIYWIGAILIQNADLVAKPVLLGDMIVFSQYAMQVVMAFMLLVMIYIILPRASVSAKRILEVLDIEVSVKDGTVTDSDSSVKGEVEFRNVSFSYPGSDEYMLRDINFTAHKGETVAIIGSTGSGKSTLINLVPRFYDATKGEVLVDGVNVKDYVQHSLREKIGYVSQKATLFSGTVRSNVAFGGSLQTNNADTSDIAQAVSTAQASEFVEKLPDTYDGYIAQGGTNLSGGQKQRLSIARAIHRRPEILIFDDSFSALDYKTDRKLRQQLVKDCADSTKIIVAQRIGTIRDADRIIVLDEGKIAGIGTHNELMASCSVYQQIAYSQLSKEELA